MADKFLNTGGGGNANITNGSANIYAATLGADNLEPSKAIKTNSVKQLVSTNLDIADVNNLQDELDNIISNPFAGTLQADDFKSDSLKDKTETSTINLTDTEIDIVATSVKINGQAVDTSVDLQEAYTNGVNGEIQLDTSKPLTIKAVDTSNLLNVDGDLKVITAGGILNMSNQRINTLADPVNPQNATTKNYVDTEITNAINGISTNITDLETKTQNIDLATTTAGNTNFNGVIQQGLNVKIGEQAGINNPSTYAIAIGSNAGKNNARPHAIAIGTQAGFDSSGGDKQIAIGFSAGRIAMPAKTIALGSDAYPPGTPNTGQAGFYLGKACIRNVDSANTLKYDPATGEITQFNVPEIDVSDLETKTQNISLSTVSGQTDIEGVINNTGITTQKPAVITQLNNGATNILKGTWGFAFDVLSPITMTTIKLALADWRDPSNTKEIGLWEDGNPTALYTGILTKTNVVGGYAVENITPTPLSQGGRYLIGIRFLDTDSFEPEVNPPVSPEIDIYGLRTNNNSGVPSDTGFSYPSFSPNGNDNRASFGNFDFEVSGTGEIRTTKIIMTDNDGLGFLADITNFEGLKVRDGIKSINYDDDAFMRITSSSNLFNFTWNSADQPQNDGDFISYRQNSGINDGRLTITTPNNTDGELLLTAPNMTIDSNNFIVDCVMNATDFVKYQGGVDYLNPVGINSLAAVGYVNQEIANIPPTDLSELENKTQNISTLTSAGDTRYTGNHSFYTGPLVGGNIFSINTGVPSDTFTARIFDTIGGTVNTTATLNTTNIRPDVDATRDIGTSSLKYENIYGDNLIATNEIVCGTQTIATNTTRGAFDATNDGILFQDDYVIIRWNGTNKQPTYSVKTGFTGYWDVAMEVIKNDDALYANQDIFSNVGDEYYFTGGTTVDANYNAVLYSTRFNCFLHKESGNNAPSYNIVVKTGNINGPAVYMIDIIKPAGVAFNALANSSPRLPSPPVVRVSNRTRIEQLEAQVLELTNRLNELTN